MEHDLSPHTEHDITFPTSERHRAEEILAEIKATYHVQVFSGVEHGFAARGDITLENIRKLVHWMLYVVELRLI